MQETIQKRFIYFSILISNGQMMAFLGHTSSQFPHHLVQSEHLFSSWKAATFSTITKALQEHVVTHTPHPSHFSLSIFGIPGLTTPTYSLQSQSNSFL